MKFIVDSAALLKQLNNIAGVVPSNPVVSILDHFLFEIKDEILSITASDLQTTMITEMAVTTEENGSIAIPARMLTDTLKNLPQQPVTFHLDMESFAVEIVSQNGHYKLSGQNDIDFPRVSELSKPVSITIPATILSKAINSTIFCTSSDDLRPAMGGVYFDLKEDHGIFVATDGHRLVRFRRDDITIQEETTMILPRKALNLLKGAMPSDDAEVIMSFNQNNSFFRVHNITMICRLIDERFPDYEAAIPLVNPLTMEINRSELLNSLKRIDIYANRATHQVRLKINEDALVISAEDLDFSNQADETLTCEFNGDKPFEIGFNAKLLIELLSNLNSTVASFQLSESNKPCLIVPGKQDANEEITMLLMPVMLNSYA